MSRLHDPEVLVSHVNARLTPHGRWLLVQRVRFQGRPVAHVARELGVSRQCAHRWVARFDALGRAGPVDRSSRPLSSPRATPTGVVAAVVAERVRLRCGPDELSRRAGVAARTVSRILRRSGVPYLWQCDPVTGEVIRAKGPTCAAFIDRALVYFASLGAPVRPILTDNHWSYARSSDVRDVLAGHHADHWYIKAHCPWQNGKVVTASLDPIDDRVDAVVHL
jgi:transposase-like protein